LDNKTLVTVIRWLVVMAMPFFLGFVTITLIINPAYPRYEYAKENFPADPFGFTQADRLALALMAVDYLERREPAEEVIYLLAEQRMPGSDQPLYNQEEIRHMIDVKRLTDAIRRLAWITAGIVIGGLVFLLVRPETRPEAYKAIMHGGMATTAVLLGIALFILLGWSIFFVQFHELLFPPGTWTFAYSDGLIRLFPEKFWFDLGVILSLSTLLEGIVVAAVGYLLLRNT
jgi:integral membrane protein (TIGR01906 family)